MTAEEFIARHGSKRVLYVPGHAHGDTEHFDCERGRPIRASADPRTVFVHYEGDQQPKATTVSDLLVWGLNGWEEPS